MPGELLSGNKSGRVWNPQAVRELSELLTGKGYEKTIFPADCALVSAESLLKPDEQNIQFISRFPETFDLAEELKTEAWIHGNREDSGSLAEKPADRTSGYRGWQTVREIEGKSFGFVAVHSSNPEQRKERSLNKAVGRVQKELCQQSAELQKQPFAREPDAMRASEKLRELAEKKGFESSISLKKVGNYSVEF
ncbi:hypothetical protein FACS1894167_14640 [Synergistales bacterium]|nr:hypothetical protein FACS1894167_14640 [Synergistales bacterium]